MQTITTRFIGPTNFRGSRYKAVAGEGGKGFTLTLDADQSIGSTENHERVARQLIRQLGWFHESDRGDTYGDWFSGDLAGSGYVFVCAVDYARLNPACQETR